MILKSKVHGFDMVEPLGILYFPEYYGFHCPKYIHLNLIFKYDANLYLDILGGTGGGGC